MFPLCRSESPYIPPIDPLPWDKHENDDAGPFHYYLELMMKGKFEYDDGINLNDMEKFLPGLTHYVTVCQSGLSALLWSADGQDVGTGALEGQEDRTGQDTHTHSPTLPMSLPCQPAMTPPHTRPSQSPGYCYRFIVTMIRQPTVSFDRLHSKIHRRPTTTPWNVAQYVHYLARITTMPHYKGLPLPPASAHICIQSASTNQSPAPLQQFSKTEEENLREGEKQRNTPTMHLSQGGARATLSPHRARRQVQPSSQHAVR
ncbi:unnamed protein product [Coregonus sp. 'balchen']|nr:unnamed protein product [Coregonus sp. 'balchen']